tara:strand:+ start:364 stop:708 length:345 start_codon:yes stop_codon:yes gene_type:complete
MEDIIKNKLFWVVAIVFCMNIGVFVIGKVVVDKAADKVIERLEKDYSPSPYGPGFDPDKVNVLRQLYYEIKQQRTPEGDVFESEFSSPGFRASVRDADRWRYEWEADRGANPSQ